METLFIERQKKREEAEKKQSNKNDYATSLKMLREKLEFLQKDNFEAVLKWQDHSINVLLIKLSN